MSRSETAFGTPEARVQTFVYNLDGTVASTTQGEASDPDKRTTGFTYYVRGLLKTVTDANSKVTTYGDTTLTDGDYHASGNPKRIEDPTGAFATFEFDFLGRNTQKIDRESKTWTSEFDLRGNITKSTDPLSQSRLLCYDGNDNLVLVVPPRADPQSCALDGTDGHSIKTDYTARDQIAQVLTKSEDKQRKSIYAYNDDGTLNHILEPRSFDPDTGDAMTTLQKAGYLYYPNNRLQSFTDEEGGKTDVVYTPHGLPARVTAPVSTGTRRHETAYTYNRRGQVLTAAEEGHTNPTGFGYNLHGDRTTVTPPKGNTTTTEYNQFGQANKVIDPAGKLSVRTFDPVGNLLTLTQPKDSNGQLLTTYTYTDRNEIKTETDPADPAHIIEYVYDGEGRQEFRYDKHNGATERTVQQTWRDNGSLLERKATGTGLTEQRSTFGYDADGNMTSVKTYAGGSSNVNVSEITATYTSSEELDTLSETIFGPATDVLGETVISNFDWAQDGLLKQRETDGKTTGYTHQLNGLERTATPFGGLGTLTNDWLPNGSLEKVELPNGSTIEHTFDDADRTTNRIVKNSSGTKLSSWESIGWDDNDNRTGETVSQRQVDGSNPTPGTASYGYDTQERLTSAKHPFETATAGYTLDDAGNILAEAGNPAGTGEFTYSFTDNRLITRTPTDPAGAA
ncbi:MAG: hypothetical protein WD178_10255, partial [Actinomycetota bacterium]